jgi:molecular chaperone GrpE
VDAQTDLENATDPGAIGELVRSAVHDEFDAVVPHLLTALKRDRAFDALSDRLREAERRLDSRRERPLAVAVLGLLDHVRHLSFDPEAKSVLEAELVRMLAAAGFEEFGTTGERFDPDLHNAIDGRTSGGRGVVSVVHAAGLRSYGEVVVRAKVAVVPPQDSPSPTPTPGPEA